MKNVERQPNVLVSDNETPIIKPVDEDALKKRIEESIVTLENLIRSKTTELENKINASVFGFPDYSKNLNHIDPLPYPTWLFVNKAGRGGSASVYINGVHVSWAGSSGNYWDDSTCSFPIPANATIKIDGAGWNIRRYRCL